MRRVVGIFGLALIFAGCFDPQIKSGGFTCNPPDHPECPGGLQCVNGYCIQPGGVVPYTGDLAEAAVADLSITSLPDLSAPPLPDLAKPPADMAKPPADMAKPPSDMAMPKTPDMAKPACVATGGDCTYHKDAVCCSAYCVYSSNTCR